MTRPVWFKLPNFPVEFVLMADGVDRIQDLREKILFHYLMLNPQDPVKFYAGPAEKQANRPLDLEAQVDGLGMDLKHPILVDALMYRSIHTSMFGVKLDAPRLERVQLLDQLYDSLISAQRRFVHLTAPHASGKRALLSLFAHRHAELNCIHVQLIRGSSPNDAMRQKGLDIIGRKYFLSKDEQHVIIIYDAQRSYEDKAFWNTLIRDSPSWLPKNVRFIISAAQMESPVAFQSIHTLHRTNFLLSDEEAYEFLALPGLGLPEKMKDGKDKLAELLVGECGGLVGALRVAVSELTRAFRDNPIPSESELMAYFLSYDYHEYMQRCFCRPTAPSSTEVRRFLLKCLALSPKAIPLRLKLDEEHQKCFYLLKKAGVLVQEEGQLVRFSSPMAERFYFKRIAPQRACFDPKSLQELVTKVLGSLPASVLRASADRRNGFPDEVTFHQQLMGCIALNTNDKCSVCPELPRVFPAPASDEHQRSSLVFFVNASQKWGLEFFLNDSNSQNYTSRFAPGGLYSALEADDYAVVNLCGNANGTIPYDGVLKEKLISVFFELGNFSKCQCVFAKDDALVDIALR